MENLNCNLRYFALQWREGGLRVVRKELHKTFIIGNAVELDLVPTDRGKKGPHNIDIKI